jgi:hypothetical protein
MSGLPHRFLAFLVGAAFAFTTPAVCQVEPSASGGTTSNDDSTMMTPPPVSGMPYPNTASSETRSNYLNAGLSVTPGYIDNVLPNATAAPVGDFSCAVAPGVSLDRSTPRQSEQVTYSSIFSFYEPTSTLNTIDQSAAVITQFRLSPHVGLSIQDSILKTSNVFNESYPFSNPITGSAQASMPVVIAPFAEQFVNTTSGGISYQFATNAMIGGGGSYNIFDFPNQAQTPDFFSSNALSGSVFYDRRLSAAQYFGLVYEYERVLAYPVNATSETQVHTLLPFYTLYFNRMFSLSISAGIERIDETESPALQFNSWEPSVNASVGWRGKRGNVAASYFRSVSAGGGILGAVNSNSVSGSGGWQLSRTWIGSASVSYALLSNLGQSESSSTAVGHTVAAQASLSHTLGEHLNATFGYQHLSEDYSNIAVIAADPNSNREFVSVTYQFRRPLGR